MIGIVLTLVFGFAASSIIEFESQKDIDEMLSKYRFGVIHYYSPKSPDSGWRIPLFKKTHESFIAELDSDNKLGWMNLNIDKYPEYAQE
jgi:hypothetical protein